MQNCCKSRVPSGRALFLPLGVLDLPTYAGVALWAVVLLEIFQRYPMLSYIYYLLARREGAGVEAQFGDRYRQYRATTPTFIPRFRGSYTEF